MHFVHLLVWSYCQSNRFTTRGESWRGSRCIKNNFKW
jgi:hypothetical protein